MNEYGEGAAMKLFRVEKYFFNHRMRLFSQIIYYLIQIIFNCIIPPTVEIGKGSCIAHGVGIVVHHNTIIGNNVKIYQNVTIGHPGVIIGDDCLIGAGAIILGPCKIGDNVKIGANVVVNSDVPSNSTVFCENCRIVTR